MNAAAIDVILGQQLNHKVQLWLTNGEPVVGTVTGQTPDVVQLTVNQGNDILTLRKNAVIGVLLYGKRRGPDD